MSKNKKHLLSITEFAQYEGISVITVRRRINRKQILTIKIKAEKGHRKNHIEYRIPFMELSTEETRAAFLKDRGLLPANKKKIQVDEFSNLKPWQKEIANKRQAVVKEYLNIIKDAPRGKITQVKRHFARLHDIYYRTLDRWAEAYKSGGFYALVPNWNPGKQKNKIENDKEVCKFIDNTFMMPFGPSIKETHERYVKEFEHRRESLFSYTTLDDYINRTWTESERLLARNPDEWQKHHGIYVNRDWTKVEINEVWFSDAKQIDIACLYNDRVIFPWLTAFMDAKSRKFVGWVLTATPDKWAISQAFDYGIATHGIPKVIYIDRGKPYKSHHISGGKLTAGKIVNLFEDIEEEPFIGVFRELGCDIFFAYPRNAKEKIIEAAFGIFTDRLSYVPGWRSHDTKHRPRKLEQEIKQKEILSFHELYREINRVIEERNARPHSTTKKVPNDFYKNYTPIVPSEAIRTFLKMDRHFVKIRNSGIKIKDDFYRGKELWRHSGESVEVRRDPANILKAAVIKGNSLLEIARLEAAGHYRSPITLKNRETVAKISKNIRRERKKLIAREEEIFTNPDPLKVAMEMDEEVKLKHREIRPASNIRSIHQREKLAREAVEGLKKDHEIDLEESTEREIATAHKPSMWSRYMKVMEKKRSQKEAQQPQLRLIPRERLTMYQDDDED